MQIQIELHGVLCRLAGAQRLTVPLPEPATVADVIAAVEARVPEMAERLEVTACAIDDTLVPRNTLLSGDEILVLIPPVSGG
ncbi:MAG: MoaD/ThiS family protein [Stenotrophobium sp.]